MIEKEINFYYSIQKKREKIERKSKKTFLWFDDDALELLAHYSHISTHIYIS